MRVIDLNADIGEADNPVWAASETKILSYVSSANIACGGHAGNAETMRRTVVEALKTGTVIGAHPAYPDRKNFGRQSLVLGDDISVNALKETLKKQIHDLMEIAAKAGTQIDYVKPHGALYNDAVKEAQKAELIIEVIADIDPRLSLLGGPNSAMTQAAESAGIRFIAEGFIDRRYTNDGHLLSRQSEGAVLPTDAQRVAQAISLVFERSVDTYEGGTIPLIADSLCLHGDSAGAVETAIKTRKALETKGVEIRTFSMLNIKDENGTIYAAQ